MAKYYRIHWWHDDLGGWEIEPAGSEEAELMQSDPLVEIDPELVADYERIRQEYEDICEKIQRVRDSQVRLTEERKWVLR